MSFECNECGKSFKSILGLNGHLRVHGASGGKLDAQKIINEQKRKQREAEYLLDPIRCIQCSKPIPRKKAIKEKQTFCNASCSATHTNLNRERKSWAGRYPKQVNIDRIRTLTKRPYSPEGKSYELKLYNFVDNTFSPKMVRVFGMLKSEVEAKLTSTEYPCTKVRYNRCAHCGKGSVGRINVRYCSEHSDLYKSKNRNRYAFTFNVFDYPELFDVELIKEKGWHSHGGRFKYNSEGLTRDHKVSVNEAIRNNLDPFYIKHPLNCEIMTFDANNQKKTKCSISYEELVSAVDAYESAKVKELFVGKRR